MSDAGLWQAPELVLSHCHRVVRDWWRIMQKLMCFLVVSLHEPEPRLFEGLYHAVSVFIRAKVKVTLTNCVEQFVRGRILQLEPRSWRTEG